MKIEKVLSVLILVLLCFSIVGCSNKAEDEEYKAITDLYTVTKSDSNTYSYSFSNLEGKVLFEKEDVAREPKINQITATTYELITQTGTGLSTNWTV